MAENPWQVVSEKPATQATDPWAVVSEKPAAPPPAAGGPSQQFAALQQQAGNNYQAAPNEATQEGNDAAAAQRLASAPPVAKQIGQVGKAVAPVVAPLVNVGVGGIKGAAQGGLGEPEGAAEKIGSAAEGVGEFVMGDEMAKSLSVAERLGVAQKLAKIAEESPIAGKIVKAGLNALRQGAVGGAQGLAKGESPTDALKTAATTAGTSLAVEPIAAGIKALAPTVKDIAGEKVPVRASQDSGVARVAEDVSRTKPLQKFDVEKTQPAAKKAIGAVASDVPSKDISLGAKAAVPAKDLGERAEQIRAQSKPVFEKLDDITKNDPTKFSDWQKKEKMAFRKGDYDAVKEAQDAQEKIWQDNKGQFSPADYKNARANWRQSSALDKVHDAFNTKAVVQPTPVDFRPTGQPDPGYINGKNLSKTILSLKGKGVLADAGLTPKHIQALQDLSTALEKSGSVQDAGGQLGKALKLAKVAVKSTVGVGTAGAGYVASAALGKLLTDEKAAVGVAKVLQSGVPAAAAQASRPEKAALDKALDAAGVPKNDDPLQRTIAFRKMKDLPEDVKDAAQKAISAFSNSLVKKAS